MRSIAGRKFSENTEAAPPNDCGHAVAVSHTSRGKLIDSKHSFAHGRLVGKLKAKNFLPLWGSQTT